MADADIPITAGTGTKVDTRTVGPGTDEHRQVMVIGSPTTAAAVAEVDSTLAAMKSAGSSYAAVSGTITTATSTITTGNIALAGNITIYLFGTYAGVNATFEISPDNTNWFPVASTREDTAVSETTTGVLAANQSRAWTTGAPGFAFFRVRATAWTSGTANIVIVAGTYPFEPLVSAVTSSIGSANSTVTNQAASATNVTLKAANTARKALYIFNAGTSNLFVKLGATATTTTSFTHMIPANGFWELPDDPVYTGIVDGIWTATGGSGANVTELT